MTPKYLKQLNQARATLEFVRDHAVFPIGMIYLDPWKPAVKLLDEKIAEQGENEEVIQEERQMIYLLVSVDAESKKS